MKPGRLEAFSDGVLAIVITIMALELSAPLGSELTDLKPLIPKFISYILSFAYVGIYWNNHHHLFQATQQVNGALLWYNLVLLFMISLIPFSTAWMGQNHFAPLPVASYGINLLLCAMAYALLSKALVKSEGRQSILAKALHNQSKETISVALYAAGILLAFQWPYLSLAAYFGVAIMWIIPDRRIEQAMHSQSKGPISKD
jgi:uncharacterized membrane protein